MMFSLIAKRNPKGYVRSHFFMRIRQILDQSCIISPLKSTSKKEVLEELSKSIGGFLHDVKPEEIFSTLCEREGLGSTGIGNGVAIPHGKIRALSSIVCAFGRSPSGIEFDSQDGRPAHLFFVLLAPENAASLHLKALARLSRLLKDAEFRNKLLETENSGDLFKLITDEDEKV